MDWLQFVSSIVGSLAWPVASVAVIVLVRAELLRALQRLKRFKYGNAEVEFGEKLREVELDIAKLPAPDPSLLRDDEPVEARRVDVDDFSNNSAIFVAWLDVESAILNLARVAKILEPNMPASKAASVLRNKKVIDESSYRAILELMELRNIAVHPSYSRPILEEEVNRFRALSNKIAVALADWQKILY